MVVPGPREADDQDARARAFAERYPAIRGAAPDRDGIRDAFAAAKRRGDEATNPTTDSEAATGTREAAEYLLAIAGGRG